MTHQLENNHTKKFSHCCQGSRPHIRLPNLGAWKRDWKPQGIWLWKSVGFDDRTSTVPEERGTWGAKQNLGCARSQGEKHYFRADELDLPVWRRRSRAACLAVKGAGSHSPGRQGYVAIDALRGGHRQPHQTACSSTTETVDSRTGLPQARLLTEGAQSDPWAERWLRFIEHCPAHHSKSQFFPQPGPPTRKLAQASYPHPSEGRQKKSELQSHGLQNGYHNHRKLTKMITWITTLCKFNEAMSHAVQDHPRWTGHSGEFWQNMAH